jgi:hypothetical protein
MRVKTRAQKNKIGKNVVANSATSWVPSVFKQRDLEKAQANSLISANDQVTFPSTERIPKPPSGFRVMFFDFLLRGLSLPTHEFLRGLLFFYSVQLHQLTPNSILHIANFITLYESFWGSNPTFSSGNSYSGSVPALLYQRNLNWAGLLSLFMLNRII